MSKKRNVSPRTMLMLSIVALAGCGFEPHQAVDPTDPALISKLGITQEDWLAIQRLSSERADYIVVDFEKISSEGVEVSFKSRSDTNNDQGGPVDRYEKKNGSWRKVPNFIGNWAPVVLSPKK